MLRTHDRYGVRVDDVEFHPAWTSLLRLGKYAGWRRRRPVARAQTRRARGRGATRSTSSPQAEAASCCPLSMTYASMPALRHEPTLAAEWEPRLLDTPHPSTAGATCGMAMTEKQGGSDVRTNTTTARPVGDCDYLLTGHKWFCSAPMSDGFLMLAQAPAGLSCFWVPAMDSRRGAQPHRHPTPQGQARRSVERLERDRAARDLGRPRRRRRCGRPDDHRDGRVTPDSTARSARQPSCASVWHKRRGTRTTARRSARCSTISR